VDERIGPADRADRDADVEGEVALRRQLAAGWQRAAGRKDREAKLSW
jgi:hypothetical protein